ncbi:MAG TPA: hypothetical protein VEF34_21145 [Syntrophobacteraceae bacterium]|nr:hypothetical protein [Syntrophobacteraceae bacterium]
MRTENIDESLLGPDIAKRVSLSEFFEDSRYPKLVLAVGAILLLVLQYGIFIALCDQSGLISMLILWLIPSILGDPAADFFCTVKDYAFFFAGGQYLLEQV